MTIKIKSLLSLVTGLLLAFSLIVKTSSANQGNVTLEDMINASPRELIGHPLRYTVIAYDNTVRERYQSALEQMTTDQIMVYQPSISHVNEVDVLVYLLDDWSNVSMLPGRDLFAEQIPDLRVLKPDRVYEVLHATIEDGGLGGKERPLYLFFLPVGYHQSTEHWPRCFSELTVQQITVPSRDLARVPDGAKADLFHGIDCLISE